jgi:chemotaxis protein histidine kinase CheA
MDKDVARIVRPENKLKQKIGTDVNLRELLQPEVVQGAQQVIADKKEEFLDWTRDDLLKMEEAFTKLRIEAPTAPPLVTISRHAETLRDRSGTFGYQLGSDIAKSLAKYSTQTNPQNPHLLVVLRSHMDGLQTVFKDHVTDSGGIIGMELLQSLKKLVEKYPPA